MEKLISPIISVIVPVFNTQNYLEKCINSILIQTFKEIELILIDDGSTDMSGEICKKYTCMDQRIKLIKQANGGVSLARNKGIEFAVGKYIIFVDSDDWVEKEFFEKAYRIMETCAIEWYMSGFIEETYKDSIKTTVVPYCIEESQIYSVKLLLEEYNIKFKYGITSVWNKLYLASIIKKNHIEFINSMNYGEDTNFNLRYLKYCKNIYFENSIFYHYIKTERISLSNNNQYLNDLFEACVRNAVDFESLCIINKCSDRCLERNRNRFIVDVMYCIEQEFKFKKSKKSIYELLQKMSNNDYLQNIYVSKEDTFIFLLFYFLKRGKIKLTYGLFYLQKHILFGGTLSHHLSGFLKFFHNL